MKTSTKTIIFLVVAFIIVLGITLAMRSTVAPETNTMPTQSGLPTATSTTTSVPSTPAAAAYTMAEVAKHTTASDCWTVVNGEVYNLSSFTGKHPGGVPAISKICGVDGTAIFTAQHGGQENPMKMIATLKIGTLKK